MVSMNSEREVRLAQSPTSFLISIHYKITGLSRMFCIYFSPVCFVFINRGESVREKEAETKRETYLHMSGKSEKGLHFMARKWAFRNKILSLSACAFVKSFNARVPGVFVWLWFWAHFRAHRWAELDSCDLMFSNFIVVVPSTKGALRFSENF